MVRTPEAATLGTDTYQRVRSALLEGRYAPEERLVAADLTDEFAVPAGVVREALTRLASEGLGVAQPNRGYRVMSAGETQVQELVELRAVAEDTAVRLAIARGDLAWEADVLAAHHRHTGGGPGGDQKERAARHRDFHLAVLSGCGNSRLVDLCRSLSTEAELYRTWARLEVGRPEATHSRSGNREHRAIVDAVLARDADRASELVVAHLRRTEKLALDYVRRGRKGTSA